MKKKTRTANEVPLPLPKNEPTYIHKNIAEDDIILKLIPTIEPTIKNKNINIVFPNPIPKCDPTYDI
tara:strand:- start:15 stop:215 length:201 start_codon:yes stop_codon:yes gene_type:complete